MQTRSFPLDQEYWTGSPAQLVKDSEFITLIIFVSAMLIYHKITGYSSGLSTFDIMMFLFGIPIIMLIIDTILGIYEYRRKKQQKNK